MISVEGLKVEFSARPLFHDVSFVINDRDRIALVGKNGAGKSTLLKILCGQQQPTAGTVAIPNDTTIGYLPQVMKLQDNTTVREETRKAFASTIKMKERVDKLAAEMAERTDYESDDYMQLVERYTQEHDRYMMIGGESYEADMERTLVGLGFSRTDMDRPTSEFSGGWRMRIELAKILLQKPDVLLLDEPTNHLDIESIQWLEQFLAQSAKAVVLVSHDRAFINNVSNRTIEITCGQAVDYKVKYNEYVVLRAERREQQIRAYENSRQIGESLSQADACLNSYEQENARDLIGAAAKCVSDAAKYDASLAPCVESFAQVQELLQDIGRSLGHYIESMEFDAQTYTDTKERLDTINKCKTKYGNTISEILAYAQNQQEFLHKYDDFEQYKIKLQEELAQQKETLLALCQKASKIRCKEAAKLEKEMKQALLSLNFPYVDFAIEVENSETHLSTNGMDHVRFLISLNAGQEKKPLSQVASGGELSRIMLALKSVLAEQDETETLIFDEIDAGISGRTAWKISEKLAILGRAHQVICITHLPQIAAMADQHFVIEKQQDKNGTQTKLTALSKDGMLSEIARLLGSDKITDAVMQNAGELKAMADEAKKTAK